MSAEFTTTSSQQPETWLDSLVEEFEQAWQSGTRPDIAPFLARVEERDRSRLLAELLHVDLERRVQAGDTMPVVEGYQQLFAKDLSDATLLSIIEHEYRVRLNAGRSDVSREEYLRRFPQLAAELERRLPTGSSPLPKLSGGRYRVEASIDEGGQGAIFAAHDLELHRTVALKCLKGDHADSREVQERFLQEAEVTANLEHPGIVPIYGLTQDDQGRPCYAMRYIQGESLHHAIGRFFGKEETLPRLPATRFESVAFRQLLQQFVAVCNAIAYAHSRGILHRDIKPRNIMLGKYGETLVVDWGLNKPISRREEHKKSGELTLRPKSDSSQQKTRYGSAAGTPSYMSPEQAAGRWSDVGERSDVYGLGATLFHILAGQAPFKEWTEEPLATFLARVQLGQFQPPRKVQPAAPAALEAVCMKAMARDPQDRYATALELAAEVEKHLAGEPATAWREPWWSQVQRFRKRHRAVMMLAGAACVVVLVTVFGGLALWGKQAQLVAAEERERASDALRQAADEKLQVNQLKEQQAVEREQWALQQNELLREERASAERSYQLAHDAVAEFSRQVVESPELNDATMHAARRRLLQSAFGFYRQLVELKQGDSRRLAELARARLQLADITSGLGDKQGALAIYERAIEDLEQLDRTKRDGREPPALSPEVLVRMGTLCQDAGDLEKAKGTYELALRLCRHNVKPNPGQLAGVLTRLGRLAQDTGSPHVAMARYQDALETLEGESEAHHAVTAELLGSQGELLMLSGQYRDALRKYDDALWVHVRGFGKDDGLSARFRLGRAQLCQALGRLADAERDLTIVLRVHASSAAQNGHVPGPRRDLAQSQALLASLLWSTGRRNEALHLADQAVETMPKASQFQADLVRRLLLKGRLHTSASDVAVAEEALEQAAELQKLLIWTQPELPRRTAKDTALAGTAPVNQHDLRFDVAEGRHQPHAELVRCLVALGDLYGIAERNEDSAQVLTEAAAIWRRLAETYPQFIAYQAGLASTLAKRGLSQRAFSAVAARASYQEALRIQQELAQRDLLDLEQRTHLGNTLANFANLERDEGQRELALPRYDEAVTHLDAVLQESPGYLTAILALRSAHWGRALAQGRAGKHQLALVDWRRALELQERLRLPDNPADVLQIRLGLAATLAHLGMATEAISTVETVVKDTGLTSDTHYDAACVFAICSQQANGDPPLRDRHAARAVELLQQAVKLGYKDVKHLEKDSDLDALRQRPDFQQLVKELKAKP